MSHVTNKFSECDNFFWALQRHKLCELLVSYVCLCSVRRLYSCLANGSADEFQKGEQLFKSKSVSNALQIGK